MGKYDFEFDLFQDDTLAWIAQEIAEGSKVLEFGAANGRLTKYLSRQKKCLVDIVEIDRSSGSEAAQYARHALLGPAEGDIEKYGWTEFGREYDYIVFADVLEHLVNPQDVLKKCKAVLKQKGKILVSVPNVAHNSIIIDLFNDRFEYNSIGLLDNTHLRFFTRQSFIRMAQQAGWAAAGERAKYIRVGENEIANSYQDVPKEVFKELVKREQADVYQYMFTLVNTQEYLTGQYERTVDLDAYSYYYAEILFEHQGQFHYAKSGARHINPAQGNVRIRLSAAEGRAQLYPLNCSCVFHINEFAAETPDGKRKIKEFAHNGTVIGEDYYFIHEKPCFVLAFDHRDRGVLLDLDIYKYDFEDTVLERLCKNIVQKEQRIQEICKDYEAEIAGKEQEKEQRIQEICKNYEAEIARKEQEKEQRIQEICEDYEAEIARKEQEFQARTQIYQKKTGQMGVRLRKLKKKLQDWHFWKPEKGNPPVISIYGKNECCPKIKHARREVCAVVPNYNYARFLNERIDSILFQTYPVKEIIILDDCSTDNSVFVIQEKIRKNETGIPMRLVQNACNSGSVFSQWQKAFQEADTEFVWIAEADDSSDARFLETVMQGFEDERVIISYCESLTMDENNVLLMHDLRPWIDIFSCGKWKENYKKDGKQEAAETMCINNTIANVSSAVIRNGDYYEILEEAKAFQLAGDWYVYLNLLKRGWIAYYRESLNYHRMQAQGLTLTTSGAQEFDEIVRMQDYALRSFDIPGCVRQKVYERRERERIRFGL